MKILIIRFSSIGDIILTTPVIRCLKTQVPGARIHYLTKKQFQPVLQHNPYIDQLHFLEQGDMVPLVLSLLNEQFDVIIDLHHNIRTRYIIHMLKQAWKSRVKAYRFPKLNLRKWLLTQFHIQTLPDRSIVERYFETVKKLHVKNDGQGLDYFIGAEDEIKKEDLPVSHSMGFVALSIGGQHATKKMPVNKWKEFCASFDFPMVLLGGPEDAENAELIRAADPVKIYNACGKFTLNESAHIIRKARFVITHDTGLMHMAAAFKKRIISIWGNTVPELGMFPYYGYNNLHSNVSPFSVLMEVKNVSCRPCSKIGYRECPKKHFRCMNNQDIPLLLQKADQFRKEA